MASVFPSVEQTGGWSIRVLFILLVVGCVVWLPTMTVAAPNRAASRASDPAEEEPLDPLRKHHFRSYTKIRNGSFVRRKHALRPREERRSDLERRRDHEVIKHYGRMAYLDVIKKVAIADGEHKVADRAEAVRRAEKERFRRVLVRLRQITERRMARGGL